jgi:hypothetical protein
VVVSGKYSGNSENSLKKLDQYIISQVQNSKDHVIAVKQEFDA